MVTSQDSISIEKWLEATHSLTSIPTLTHAILSTKKLCTGFINFPPTPCTLSICRITCGIVSYTFTKSINTQSLTLSRYFSNIYLTIDTWSMHRLPYLKPQCTSHIAHSVPALTLWIRTLPYSLPTTHNKIIHFESLHSFLSPFPLYRGTYMYHISP